MPVLRLLVLLALFVPLKAATLVDRIKDAATSVPSLRLTFVQSKHIALFDETVTTPGLIEIDRVHGHLRWEFTGRSVFIFSQGRLRKWGADGQEERGLDRDPNLAALRAQMHALLSGDWSAIEDRFTITADAEAIDLVPVDPVVVRYLTRIRIGFRADLSAPDYLELHAAGGDRTDYRFAEPELGAAIDASRFSGP